jgi:hypothetical protein
MIPKASPSPPIQFILLIFVPDIASPEIEVGFPPMVAKADIAMHSIPEATVFVKFGPVALHVHLQRDSRKFSGRGSFLGRGVPAGCQAENCHQQENSGQHPFSLPDKDFPSCGGTIASVDIAVTVKTGPGKHLVRGGRSLKCLKTSVWGTRMSRSVMAGLAELRGSADQELVVTAAVGNMAIQAVLIHRRMRPHEGASFVGVAPITKLIHGIPLELGGAQTSMVFMAVGALYLSLSDRMVGGPALLSPYGLVTEIAEVRLRGF